MVPETKEAKVTGTNKPVMTPAPAQPLAPFVEMERFFDRLFPRGWLRPFAWEPVGWGEMAPLFELNALKIDVIDKETEVVIRAEVPGIDKKDLEVSLDDNLLTIKGKAAREREEEKENYFRREISRGEVSRTVLLPTAVDGARTASELKDGVLELRLPKIEKAHRVTIPVA
ncbi:MAG: Hsp20/alpha crystallin family protein [Pseudomonadota bacterium]